VDVPFAARQQGRVVIAQQGTVMVGLRQDQRQNAAGDKCREEKTEKLPGFHRISSLMVRQLALGEAGLVVAWPGKTLVYALPARFGTWDLVRSPVRLPKLPAGE
jgi:hypothetical protein